MNTLVPNFFFSNALYVCSGLVFVVFKYNWKNQNTSKENVFLKRCTMKILCQNSARKTAKMTSNKGETAENYSENNNNHTKIIYIIACAWVSAPYLLLLFHFLTFNVPFNVDWTTALLSKQHSEEQQGKKCFGVFGEFILVSAIS